MINRLIAIKLLWRLLYYLYYSSILIQWFRLWIIANTLDLLSKVFVIWCSVSYTRYTSLMFRILYQIYTFVNSRLGFSQPGSYVFNYIRTKPSRYTSIKPGCHWPTHFWLLSSSHYLGYLMRKLTSIIRKRSRLHSTGFSTSPSTIVLKGSKLHALISGQSTDRLDNLSCIYISE